MIQGLPKKLSGLDFICVHQCTSVAEEMVYSSLATLSVQRYKMGYIFEWDSRKAESNLKKHGISFDEATTIFGDPLSLLMDDPKHSADEQRFLVIGLSVQHRLLVAAFAERPPRTRIISARLATRHERKQYEQK